MARLEKEQAANHKRIEAFGQEQLDFLNGLNHAMRIPLNTLVGALAMTDSQDPAALREDYPRLAQESVHAQLLLLEDFLTNAQYRHRLFSLEAVDFDLRHLVDEVAKELAPRAAAKGIELTALVPNQLPTSLKGDANRLRQIFVRLVDHAIQVTPTGGVVEIFGNPVLTREERIEFMFEVREAGHGILPEEVTALPDDASLPGGIPAPAWSSSLGFAICQQLVAMMGGEIGVESWPDTPEGAANPPGNVFHFTVPLRRQLEPEEMPGARIEFCNLRLLAIGCRGIQSVLLDNALTQWGARVSQVPDASRAIAQLSTFALSGHPCEVVILNQKRGQAIHQELVALRQVAPDAGFILLTDWLDQSWDQAAELSGCIVCLQKPFTVERLAVAIQQLRSSPLPKDRSGPVETRDTGHDPKLAARDPEERHSPDARRLLLVDDHPANLKLAQAMLVRLGCQASQLDAVADGAQAVDMFTRYPYQLVFMDCQMPGMDGYQATRLIREWERREARSPVPIVAFTADVMPATRTACQEAGMNDFMAKPVSLSDLRHKLIQHGCHPVVSGRKPEASSNAVLELDAAMGSIGLSREDFVEIAQLILEQWPELIGTLDRAIQTMDHGAARATSHVIKGSMANTLFPQLKGLTLPLHEAIRHHGWEEAKVQLLRVHEAFVPIQSALLALIRSAASSDHAAH